LSGSAAEKSLRFRRPCSSLMLSVPSSAAYLVEGQEAVLLQLPATANLWITGMSPPSDADLCTFAQTRALLCVEFAQSKGDHHDHDRAGVPRQRPAMPVLGRVGESSGKQRRFLRPRRNLGERRHPDREMDRCAGDRSPRTFTPSGGLGLTVPAGPPFVTSAGSLAIWRRCAGPRRGWWLGHALLGIDPPITRR
jgi:hypothetical protein